MDSAFCLRPRGFVCGFDFWTFAPSLYGLHLGRLTPVIVSQGNSILYSLTNKFVGQAAEDRVPS